MWEKILSFFSDVISTIDWSQFIPSLIATFLGCVLAIYFTHLYSKSEQKKEQAEIEKNIIAELKSIKFTITNEYKVDKLYLNPIKTHYYDSLINAQKINLLATNTKFDVISQKEDNTSDLCTILDFYSAIDEFNRWNNWRTNNTNLNDSKIVDETLLTLKSEINKYIDNILGE